jgi:hypothetical protein
MQTESTVPVPVTRHVRRPPPRRNMLRKRGESPSFPDETWKNILAFICAQPLEKHKAPPATLVKLSMVSRQLRRLIEDDDEMWFDLLSRHENRFFEWQRHKRHYALTYMLHAVPGLHFSPRPDFESDTRDNTLNYFSFYPGQRVPPRIPPGDYPYWPEMCIKDRPLTAEQHALVVAHGRKSLRLNYVHRCGGCGARGKHTPFWGLNMRVCASCRTDSFVSSAELSEDCGIDFWRALPDIAGRVYYYTVQGRNRGQIDHCSASPHARLSLERAVAAKLHPGLVFFWRPHLEAVFGDLGARKVAWREERRMRARATLLAASRALFVRLAIAQRGKSVSPITSHLFFMSKPGQRSQADLVAIHGQNELGWYPGRLLLAGTMRERARAALQREFLEHAGRLTLPSIKGRSAREAVLRVLRAHEANRALDVGWYPQLSRCPPTGARHTVLRSHHGKAADPAAPRLELLPPPPLPPVPEEPEQPEQPEQFGSYLDSTDDSSDDDA